MDCARRPGAERFCWRTRLAGRRARSAPTLAPLPAGLSAGLAEVVRLAQLGRAYEARERCLALLSDEGGVQYAQPHFLLGVLASSASAPAEAERHYRAALAIEPDHPAALINLGQSLLATGHAQDAVAPLRRSVTLAPTSLEAHVNLAAALTECGHFAEAHRAANHALSIVPNDARALTLVGEVTLACGQAASAAAIASRAIAAAEPHSVDNGECVRQDHSRAQAKLIAIADAWALRAAALRKLDCPVKALEACAETLKLIPGHSRVRAMRAQLATPALRAALQPRDGDIFIATFPKSGTTWLQQIVCLLLGEPDDVHVQTRAPWVEAAVATGAFTITQLNNMSHSKRRIFKTHAPPCALPIAGGDVGDRGTVVSLASQGGSTAVNAPGCIHGVNASSLHHNGASLQRDESFAPCRPPSGVRVVVIARDPRDVAVSLYFHSRAIKAISYSGGWDKWLDDFLSGTAPLPSAAGGAGDGSEHTRRAESDWFLHTLGWWRTANAFPEQVLWLTYEDLRADASRVVSQVASFLGLHPSAERVQHVVSCSSFERMKRRHELGDGREAAALRHAGEAGHFRKGVAGGWVEHFSHEQSHRFDRILKERLRASGLEKVFRPSR